VAAPRTKQQPSSNQAASTHQQPSSKHPPATSHQPPPATTDGQLKGSKLAIWPVNMVMYDPAIIIDPDTTTFFLAQSSLARRSLCEHTQKMLWSFKSPMPPRAIKEKGYAPNLEMLYWSTPY
jgi:hypothetical protein